VRPDRQEAAVRVERQLGLGDRIAAVLVGQEALGPLVAPLDRAAERARGVQRRDVFRIGRRLHAERAADLAGQHLEPVGLDAHDLGEAAAEPERALTADPQDKAPGLVVISRQSGARLHRRHGHPAVDHAQPGHVRRLGEVRGDRVTVAERPVERRVRRRFGV
jgi:hypothetical protein